MSIRISVDVFINTEDIPEIDAAILENRDVVIHLGRSSIFLYDGEKGFDAFVEQLRAAYALATFKHAEQQLRAYE